jgi:glycosyltransferase involved in cell wall biosynthesis
VVPGFAASEDDWCIPPQTALLEALAERADLQVYALRYPERRGRYRVRGVPVLAFGAGQRRGLRRLQPTLRWVVGVARDARRRRLELLHAFFAHEPGAVAALAGRLAGIPAVVSVLGGELADLPGIGYGGLGSPVNRRLARFALERARRVVVLGPEPRRCLARLGWRVAHCEEIPFGVDTRRFRPDAVAPRLDGDPALLCAAALVPVKGHAVLLDAFGRLVAERPGAVLHLAGDGPLRGELERRASREDLAGRVRFLGEVPHAAMPALFAGAELAVVASLHEGLPTVALEALACAVPVVGSAVGLLPELPGCASVPAGDAAALGAALSRLAGDPAERARLGSAGRAHMAREDLGRCVERHLALWREVAVPA